MTAELRVAEQLVAHIERQERDAVRRLDSLVRLRRAMPQDHGVNADRFLHRDEISVLVELRRLNTAASLTARFLELRNRELDQILGMAATVA